MLLDERKRTISSRNPLGLFLYFVLGIITSCHSALTCSNLTIYGSLEHMLNKITTA